MDCVFCAIIEGKIPSQFLYRDEKMVIIKDIDPKAELHYLAIPTHHYALIEDASETDCADLGYMLSKIASLKDELGLGDGYRLVVNQGEDAGQTVHHLHIHVMGGQPLDFPDLRQNRA